MNAPSRGMRLAIGFARVEVVKAGAGSSAVGLSSYIARDEREDQTISTNYSFGQMRADLVSRGVLVPAGAPSWATNGERLWNKATEAELTTDRKTKEVRFKTDAQIAKHMVLALPKELTDAEREDLTTQFAREQFSDKGVAVEWAIHRPDGESENWHAHLIVSTRRLEADGFGKKARDLNPQFRTNAAGKRFVNEQDHWELRWTQAQNAFFLAHGIDMKVDPMKAGDAAGQHIGPVWHRKDGSEKQDAAEADAITARQAVRDDPAQVLAMITSRQATFTRQDLKRALRSFDIEGAEADDAVERALRSPEVLALFDSMTGQDVGRWTTATVREQEQETLEAVREIAAQPVQTDARLVSQVVRDLTMDEEQAEALRYAAGRAFSVVQGDAGTGKSHTMRGLRQVLEGSGYRVIGAGPTNTVAADMRAGGFQVADTLHALLWRAERGDLRLDRRSAVVVDEGAMVDSAVFHRLSIRCAQAGARLTVVGDDKQLASVARGGLYTALRAEHGDARLVGIRRQGEDWQRQASKDFAAGRVAAAIRAYGDHGCIGWTETQEEARAALVGAWATASSGQAPAVLPFIYASTNAAVDDLNRRAQAARREQGALERPVAFSTVRGDLEVSAGDRVQMHGNLKKLGVYNGTIGTIEVIRPDRSIAVRFDDGRRAILPADWREWGLGYAGTVYRGQGKTQRDVFSLYDSPVGWNREAGYVAGTRHTNNWRLFVSQDVARDEAALVRQMSRSNVREASIAYTARPQADIKAEQEAQAAQRRAEAEAAAQRERARVVKDAAARLDALGGRLEAAVGLYGAKEAHLLADGAARLQALSERLEVVQPQEAAPEWYSRYLAYLDDLWEAEEGAREMEIAERRWEAQQAAQRQHAPAPSAPSFPAAVATAPAPPSPDAAPEQPEPKPHVRAALERLEGCRAAAETQKGRVFDMLTRIYGDPKSAETMLGRLIRSLSDTHGSRSAGCGLAADRVDRDPAVLGELKGGVGWFASRDERKARQVAEGMAGALAHQVRNLAEAESDITSARMALEHAQQREVPHVPITPQATQRPPYGLETDEYEDEDDLEME